MSVVHVVVTCHDGDRRVGESRNGPDRTEKLESARQRHAQVEKNGVRPMGLGEDEAMVRGEGGPDLKAVQTEHPGEGVRHAGVVIHDEHAQGSNGGIGMHRTIVRASDEQGQGAACYSQPVFRRLGRRTVAPPEAELSPILVRPVREQLEHDRVIRLLQAKYKRKFEVGINPGSSLSAPVGVGDAALYPDLVLLSPDKARKLQGVVEVETVESVTQLEARAQWVRFGLLRADLHLYVPASVIDSTRRFCVEFAVRVAEIWTYHVVGEEIRFTLVQKNTVSHPPEPKAAVSKVAGPKVATGDKGTAEPKTAPKAVKAVSKAAPKAAPKAKPVAKAASTAKAKPAAKKTAGKLPVKPSPKPDRSSSKRPAPAKKAAAPKKSTVKRPAAKPAGKPAARKR